MVIQQTLSLPNQPVPKELLGINGGTQTVIAPAPLNPATIPLPPSVASALQFINDKTTAKQAKLAASQAKTIINATPQTITIAKQEPQPQPTAQVLAIPQSAGGGSGNGSGPLYYYVMPGNVPYNLSSEGTNDSGMSEQNSQDLRPETCNKFALEYNTEDIARAES